MSLEYIRRTYCVPAKRGTAVRYQPDTSQPARVGKITGHKNALLVVRFPESKRPYICHPHDVEYLTDRHTSTVTGGE